MSGWVHTERARLAGVAAGVLSLHLLGGALLLAHAAEHAGLVAAAVLAYTLGVRHGFDADHIAAIDNTTRRLRAAGERPVSLGFHFALGHSSVVLVLTLVLAIAAKGVPDFGGATGAIAGAASGTFLWIVGLLNLAVLADLVRVARASRTGALRSADLPAPRGVRARLGLDRVLRLVRRPWHMFPLGAVFGLGFETATEVAVLGLGASATVSGLPVLAVLALPILFAAGMTAVDSADGVLMGRAYDWGLVRPARRLAYNFTITLLSVVVALGVGTLQLIGVAAMQLDLDGGVWAWAGGIDMGLLGAVIAALLLMTWLAAMAAKQVRSL